MDPRTRQEQHQRLAEAERKLYEFDRDIKRLWQQSAYLQQQLGDDNYFGEIPETPPMAFAMASPSSGQPDRPLVPCDYRGEVVGNVRNEIAESTCGACQTAELYHCKLYQIDVTGYRTQREPYRRDCLGCVERGEHKPQGGGE